MKHIVKALFTLCLLVCTQMQAAINFGGRESAIDVTGGTLTLGANKSLSDGVLRDSGGTLDLDTATCSNMVVEVADGATTKYMKVDGTLTIDKDTPANNAITLGDDEVLVVDGGQVIETVVANGSDDNPSIMQGTGSFDAAITINNGKELVMRWEGALNKDVTVNSSGGTTKLTLENDLAFANGASTEGGSSGTSTVNFAGYKMQVGGVTIGSNAQTWDKAHLSLNGDTTISANITLTTSAGLIDGNGYKLTVSGGFLGTVGGTVTNTHIPSFDSGVFGGTGSWNLRNVILSDADESIRVNDGQLTAGTADVFAGAATWSAASNIELLKDMTLVDEWQFDGASHLNGNSHTLKFTDTTGTIDYDASLTLSDIVLTNVSAASFDNAAGTTLQLRNVDWHDGAQAGSVRINASPLVDGIQYAELTLATSATAGALFGGDVTWGEGAQIDLLSNTTLTSTWTLSKATIINGDNNTFNLVGGTINYDADLHLSDIVLADVDAAAFNNDADMDLFLSNVTWVDDTTEGIVRIAGNSEDTTAAAAQVELATSNSGNLFATAVNWKNGANIELLKGITFNTGAAWTFTKSSVINGNGNIIDLNSVSGTDPITVASGETLTISNAVIVGWGASDITFAGGTLKLSNVVIVLDSNVTLGSTEDIVVDGPLSIITDNYVFDASDAGSSNYINGVTVWYDTLGHLPQGQLRMGAFSGTGRIAMSPLADWADITFSTGSSHLVYPLRLSYDCNVGGDGVFEALGRKVVLDNTVAFSFLGDGRSLYMGKVPVSGDTTVTSDKLITVSGSASNVVELHDVVLDGWSENHISDSNTLLRYCTGTVIKLQNDEALTSTLNIAVDSASESIVIDLNGYDLDMGSDNAALTISATDATVTIKNGRLINFDDNSGSPKLTSGDAYSTWVFQDVDMVLAGNTTLSGNNIQFKGDCTVTGTGDYSLKCYHTPITIAQGARLTVDKNMTLALHGNGTSTDTSITFASNNSTLSLEGATFDVSNLVAAPTFTHGTIRIDDVATFAGDMTLGSSTAILDLDIDLMPAASIEISSGTVTYANAS